MEYKGEFKGYKCYKLDKGECALKRDDNIYLLSCPSGYKMYLWEEEVGQTDRALNVEWFAVPIGIEREVAEYRVLKEALFSIEPEEKEKEVATAKTVSVAITTTTSTTTTSAATTTTSELNFDSKTWYEKELGSLLKDFNYDVAVG